jgi:hypothetical protein
MNKYVGATHPLRKLAKDIALTSHGTGKGLGLFVSANPLSLMANAVSGGWATPAVTNTSVAAAVDALCAWKGGTNGFAVTSAAKPVGLALLFDPFVDGSLLANMGPSGGIAVNSTVLVLSDYSAIEPIVRSMWQKRFSSDWAESETADVLAGKSLGTAGNQIAKAILPIAGLPSSALFSGCLAGTRLLLWNYFPFLRDDNVSVGMVGLPLVNPHWIDYCNTLLCRFVAATNARQVILACNETLRVEIRKTINCLPPGMPVHELRHPRSWTNRYVAKVDPAKFRNLL